MDFRQQLRQAGRSPLHQGLPALRICSRRITRCTVTDEYGADPVELRTHPTVACVSVFRTAVTELGAAGVAAGRAGIVSVMLLDGFAPLYTPDRAAENVRVPGLEP